LPSECCGRSTTSSGTRAGKSWDEFKSTRFDIIITVCDKAKESCPVFPGQPIIAHWSIADPAVTMGTESAKLFQFRKAAMKIRRRIDLLCAFPIEKLPHLLTQPPQQPEAEKPTVSQKFVT
jgi:protein-tyrosine-phosphatase